MEATAGSSVRRFREFASSPESVGAARDLVADALAGEAIGRGLLTDIQLAISELVTNAVVHGDGGPVTLRIDVSPTTIVCDITSRFAGAQPPDPAAWKAPAAGGPTGRGLVIVRAVADTVAVMVEESAVTVRCVFERR